MAITSWQCPFCGKYTSITEYDRTTKQHNLEITNRHGVKSIVTDIIVCPNPECKEFTLLVGLFDSEWNGYEYKLLDKIHLWNLIPPSKAKVFPDYIPQPIILDYVEACKILNDSPKASATLSRRCLQGMIRDFWGISKSRLVDEINEIKDKVDPLTWEAIDSIRKIGNIGAHMERDINLIIDVDQEEADILIGLIETLINDWYILKHEREKSLRKIIEIRDAKEEAKKK